MTHFLVQYSLQCLWSPPLSFVCRCDSLYFCWGRSGFFACCWLILEGNSNLVMYLVFVPILNPHSFCFHRWRNDLYTTRQEQTSFLPMEEKVTPWVGKLKEGTQCSLSRFTHSCLSAWKDCCVLSLAGKIILFKGMLTVVYFISHLVVNYAWGRRGHLYLISPKFKILPVPYLQEPVQLSKFISTQSHSRRETFNHISLGDLWDHGNICIILYSLIFFSERVKRLLSSDFPRGP